MVIFLPLSCLFILCLFRVYWFLHCFDSAHCPCPAIKKKVPHCFFDVVSFNFPPPPVLPSLSVVLRWWRKLVVVASVHVGEFAEARAPVVEVVIVLVASAAGGVKGAERSGRGAAALVVEDQQGVVRRGRGIGVGRLQTLGNMTTTDVLLK